MRQLLLIAVIASGLSCNGNPIGGPSTANCGLGPISTPGLIACPGAPRCPAPRPPGSRTLISLFSCTFTTGSSPCAVQAPICPLLEANGLDFSIHVSPRDTDICQSTARISIRAINDGGVQLDWTAQEVVRDIDECRTLGPPTTGVSVVSGPCCSTTVDIPFPYEQKTVRLTLQTDWQP
jgi:hypothetical protein